MGRKKHAHTTTTTTAATVGPPRTSSGGSSSDELPELPVLGHQRQWDAAKLVLRTASFAAAAAVIGFVVAFNFAGDGGRYVSANVSFGVVSLFFFFFFSFFSFLLYLK
ncbi:hypothetical protein F5X96DRAFT_118020 [Biscogniauxia mediterranea]|nr:hypothetical protein F5X96DRAFT_118020 [Biscogniauxia mediterranea]